MDMSNEVSLAIARSYAVCAKLYPKNSFRDTLNGIPEKELIQEIRSQLKSYRLEKDYAAILVLCKDAMGEGGYQSEDGVSLDKSTSAHDLMLQIAAEKILALLDWDIRYSSCKQCRREVILALDGPLPMSPQ